MTQPAPLPYMGVPAQSPEATDLSHLRILSICYYVWGGLVMLMSCFALIHVFIGLSLLSQSQSEGWILLGAGVLFIAMGWTIGILNIVSARGLARQRYRVLSFVMAGINCASFPLGTVLGVFTFIVLCRDSVKRLYQAGQGIAIGEPSIPIASHAG